MRLRVQTPAALSLIACGVVFSYPGSKYSYPIFENIFNLSLSFAFWTVLTVVVGSLLIFCRNDRVLVLVMSFSAVLFLVLGAGIFLTLGPSLGAALSVGWVIACLRGAVDLRSEIQRETSDKARVKYDAR